MSTKDDVAMGLMVMFVADMNTMFPATIAPPIDGRLAADWKVLGYLTATDALLAANGGQLAKGQEVFYGVLARSLADPTKHVAAVRGTAGIVEWIEDAKFISIDNPAGAGRVESGFWDIYASMQFKTSATDVGVPAKAGIAAAVGASGSVTVAGHSLGSALATYLAFDLAGPTLLGTRVSALFFASPHPGDDVFVSAFDARLTGRYTLYNYFLDAVPRVPFGPDYAHLPHVTDLRPSDVEARIRFELACSHHIVCYCSMLDYAQATAVPKISADACCVECVKSASGVAIAT
jgi:triacylglycerol lipase